jgi:hypothetical protein
LEGKDEPKDKLRKLLTSYSVVAIPFIFLLVACAIAFDYFFYPVIVRPDASSFNHGENGLWLGSRWYLGKANEEEKSRMIDRLVTAQVRYAYFHVRDINRLGELRYRCQGSASELLRFVRNHDPSIKAIAWVGAVSANSGGEVDLADDEVRARMVEQARWLTQDCGFDGVQWDFEVCRDGDPYFLNLLSETRSAIGSAKILSIAAPVLWSSRYYAPIARACDQVAVMCYDTLSFFPRGYVWLVSQEACRVTAAVSRVNNNCKVVLGVPTYKDSTLAHQRHAENLLMALVGVKQGLEDRRAEPAVFAGVAPYADFTTDNDEWLIYHKYWLNSMHAANAGEQHNSGG